MTFNQFIICNSCNTTIDLRAQIGYFDIKFNIHCPECLTHIYGILFIDQENIGLKFELENAHIMENVDLEIANYYVAELSAEFPTKKMYIRNIKEFDCVPYIRNFKFYDNDKKAVEATNEAMKFAKYIKSDWNKIKTLYELFWNKQRTFLFPKIENKIKKYQWIPLYKVTNDLDATMALHQLLLTTSGISSILEANSLSEYSEISKLIFKKDNYKELLKYVSYISSEFNSIEKKGFKLIDNFTKIYQQLVPIVALRSANCIDNVDRKKYGIMTANFEELTDYYAKSYEWILDNINLVIALNNIIIRNEYTSCANNKSYDNILSICSKYKKLDYIEESEPFSKPTGSLRNSIRNAIQHFDSEIDYVSQKIVFTDCYRGNKKEEYLYLMDFASLCIENFSIIIYIFELVYNLKKSYYMFKGLKPSIKL